MMYLEYNQMEKEVEGDSSRFERTNVEPSKASGREVGPSGRATADGCPKSSLPR